MGKASAKGRKASETRGISAKWYRREQKTLSPQSDLLRRYHCTSASSKSMDIRIKGWISSPVTAKAALDTEWGWSLTAQKHKWKGFIFLGRVTGKGYLLWLLLLYLGTEKQSLFCSQFLKREQMCFFSFPFPLALSGCLLFFFHLQLAILGPEEIHIPYCRLWARTSSFRRGCRSLLCHWCWWFSLGVALLQSLSDEKSFYQQLPIPQSSLLTPLHGVVIEGREIYHCKFQCIYIHRKWKFRILNGH